MSKRAVVCVSVPQGSILHGSTAFCVIYMMNKLASIVSHCLLDLYADDAEIDCSDLDLQKVENCLQSD